MSRLLAEAEWAALTHAQLITWGWVAAIAAACYGLLAVPGWISDWRRARRVTRQTQAEAAARALDITQPLPHSATPWLPADCGCAVRQWPREILTCPTHAYEKGIDLEALWREEGAR